MKFSKPLALIAGLALLAGCRTAFDPAPENPKRVAIVPGIGPNRGPILDPNVRRMPADPTPPSPSPLRRAPSVIEPRRMPAEPPPVASPLRRVPATIESIYHRFVISGRPSGTAFE